LTEQDFTIQEGEPHHIHIEIFYDPQFYDLELLIQSRDATETKKSTSSRSSAPEITHYKGSKIVSSNLEAGDYTFKIISRLPGTN
jgi:hypothetical protein